MRMSYINKQKSYFRAANQERPLVIVIAIRTVIVVIVVTIVVTAILLTAALLLTQLPHPEALLLSGSK